MYSVETFFISLSGKLSRWRVSHTKHFGRITNTIFESNVHRFTDNMRTTMVFKLHLKTMLLALVFLQCWAIIIENDTRFLNRKCVVTSRNIRKSNVCKSAMSKALKACVTLPYTTRPLKRVI